MTIPCDGPFRVRVIVPADPAVVRVPVPAEPAVIRVPVPGEMGPQGPPGPAGPVASPITYPIAGVASFTANHGLPFVPRVTLLDATGIEVDTDIHHAAGQATAVFPGPFTGTLIVG